MKAMTAKELETALGGASTSDAPLKIKVNSTSSAKPEELIPVSYADGVITAEKANTTHD